MLETKDFRFDRFGYLTIFVERISYRSLVRIVSMCTAHARRKKTKKPCMYIFLPTLTEVV
jgi:hypothetical protein